MLGPVHEMNILLHVLVYGLAGKAVHQRVAGALVELERAGGVRWKHIWLRYGHPSHSLL